jgi:hypothetical protein
MKRALQAVYGADAVIATDPAMTREAEYRGAAVINTWDVGGGNLADLAGRLIGTDAEHVRQMEGADRVYLPDKKLGEKQLRLLKMLRRLGQRVGLDGKVLAYILPEDVCGESYNDDVRVSVSRLNDAEKAIATWLHEQAHREHGTADATAGHARAITKVAARVIASYATR